MFENQTTYVEQLEFSAYRSRGNEFAEIRYFDGDIREEMVFAEQVTDFRFHDTLLRLAAKHMKNKFSAITLSFCRIHLTSDFFNALKESYINWNEGSITTLEIYKGNIWLEQAEFENMIDSLKLQKFSCNARLQNGLLYSNKVLMGIRDEALVLGKREIRGEALNCPGITDDLLESWKKAPSSHVCLQAVQTTFTLKKITEIIKLGVKNKWNATHRYGDVMLRDGDEKYLMELQKLTGAKIKIQENQYTITKSENAKSEYGYCTVFIFKCILNYD